MDSVDTCFRSEALVVSSPVCQRRASLHTPRRTSWGMQMLAPSSRKDPRDSSCTGMFDYFDLGTSSDSDSIGELERRDTLDAVAELGLSFEDDVDQTRVVLNQERFPLEDAILRSDDSVPDRPFNKWMRTLRRRALDRYQTFGGDYSPRAHENEYFESPERNRAFVHKNSVSGSSFGFVTAVKTASISLASFSVATRSKRTAVSSRQQRTDISSKASNRGRRSEDSSYISRGLVVDQGVTYRLLQRRKIIEELITTEESYVADVKFLMTVYVTFLASIPSLSMNLRASINRNLNEIVELHEEILGELHLAVPHSEYSQLNVPENPESPFNNGHTRWRSLDAVPENVAGASWFEKIPGMTAEPKIAAAVAKVFAKKMNRLFIYEEYGAKYDFMMKDVAAAYRTIPQWETYQRGIEALASSLTSFNSQQDNSKKALTIGDLLVKPIQRVCKYPLLFSELLKQTPVYDCPESHIEIENVLNRLREATTEINRATDDPRMKVTMEKTWLLQDRLTFRDMPGIWYHNSVRALGQIHLCGVLHVSWQTKSGVDGQYLICLLYRDFLLMATASKTEQVYSVQACISLADIHIEEVDNGRGLQCHTAPFSWKLVFECDHHLYEITMTACSSKEELEWRSRVIERSSKESLDLGEQTMFTSLSLPIKTIGSVFGKPGTVARRISIHRATTVGSNTGRCQVIIKNTNALKQSTSSTSINRSQSLLTTNRIPVLAPTRAERIRIELLLSDVWTREVLPYPGMTGRTRSERLVRTSASSMMRKLSVASIASNFTKRSGSMNSLQKTAEDEESDHAGDAVGTTAKTDKHPTADAHKPTRIERLSIIPDDKEMTARRGSADNLLDLDNSSTTDIFLRLTTIETSQSWSHDGQNIVAPPLRTSSRNHQRSTTPRSMITDLDALGMGTGMGTGMAEEKENLKGGQSPMDDQGSIPPSAGIQSSHEKELRFGKRAKRRQLVVEALSFFR